jgi:hypothetical protein
MILIPTILLQAWLWALVAVSIYVFVSYVMFKMSRQKRGVSVIPETLLLFFCLMIPMVPIYHWGYVEGDNQVRYEAEVKRSMQTMDQEYQKLDSMVQERMAQEKYPPKLTTRPTRTYEFK